MSPARAAIWLILLSSVASSALAQELTVERVVTATADARDMVRVGDRVLVATEGGLLVLRGGVVERVLGPADGLPGARLRSVSRVGDEVWVGGVEGAARIGLEDGVQVRETVPIRRVRRVVSFGDHLWFASHGGGLHRRAEDGAAEAVSLGSAHAYLRLTDLRVVGDELWVATAGVGVLRLDADGSVQGRIRRANGLPSNYVWRLVPHGERILVATIDGVGDLGVDGDADRRSAVTRAAARLPVRDVRDVRRTDNGELWLASFGGGLYRVGSGSGRPRRVGRVEGTYRLLADGRSAVLVAHRGGVHRGRGGRLEGVVGGGLPSGDVTAIAHAFGTLWVGTFDHGLARMRGGEFVSESTERWTLDRRINDLAVTGRGSHQRLWIATDRGLWWHDGRVYSRVEDPEGPSWIHTTSMHVDRGGALWVTTGRELCRRRGTEWRCWTGDSRLPVANLHSVTTDRNGVVWTGGLHGLYRFDERAGRFRRHTVSSGDLPVDWVTALVPWGDGVMAGTYHGGLAIGDESRFRIVREGDGGLPSGWVNPHAIQRFGDEVWMGTLERGLVVGRPGAWQHLTTSDGLPSDDVTDFLADSSGVWVATRGGLARLSR